MQIQHQIRRLAVNENIVYRLPSERVECPAVSTLNWGWGNVKSRFYRARQRRRKTRRQPVAQRRGSHRKGSKRGSRATFSRRWREVGGQPARNGTGGRRADHLPAEPGRQRRGAGSRGRRACRAGPGQNLGRDEHHRQGRGAAPGREGESDRRRAGGLPGIGWLSSCGDGKYCDFCRLRITWRRPTC